MEPLNRAGWEQTMDKLVIRLESRESEQAYMSSMLSELQQAYHELNQKVNLLADPCAEKPVKVPFPACEIFKSSLMPGVKIKNEKDIFKKWYLAWARTLLTVSVAIIVTFVLLKTYEFYSSKNVPEIDSFGNGTVVTRQQWQASEPINTITELVVNPPKYVIIAHTAGSPCKTTSYCKEIVKNIQQYHFSKKFSDIGYNFLVGGDGKVYVGRGWGKTGAHTIGYNSKSIGISFIGNYMTVEPPQNQINAALNFIAEGARLGKLQSNYTIYAHSQVTATLSPGQKLTDLMRKWPHWGNNTN